MGGPENGSYATNGGGGGVTMQPSPQVLVRKQSRSSTDQSNEADDVDNNPYEYPQASSSIDTTANSSNEITILNITSILFEP